MTPLGTSATDTSASIAIAPMSALLDAEARILAATQVPLVSLTPVARTSAVIEVTPLSVIVDLRPDQEDRERMKSDISRPKLIEMIERSYALEDKWCDLQADDRCGNGSAAFRMRKEALDKEMQELKSYFKDLAGQLFEAGVFSSREMAHSIINASPDARRDYIGPDGVVPDDGTLNPDEEADGILALFGDKDFYFRAPIAQGIGGKPLNLWVERKPLKARITSAHDSLKHPEKNARRKYYADDQTKRSSYETSYIWVEGEITAKA